MDNTIIVNLFAGPGAGKSTVASGLFYELKKRNISCDVPYEYPKQLAWNESNNEIKDQLYVIANQHRGIVRSYGKVDYIILDSPLILALTYKNNYTLDYPANLYDEKFDNLIIDVFKKYKNINFFLRRPKKEFEDSGRFHNLEESINLDNKIQKLLDDNNIFYEEIDVDENTVKNILKVMQI